MVKRRSIPRIHLVVLGGLALLLLVTTQFFMADIGYVYEELLPHQRILPRTLAVGYVLNHAPPGADLSGIRFAHGEGSSPECRSALSDQWPTFAVVCGNDVYPVLSETYQGNWLYYVSTLWQAVFGSSLRTIRLQSLVFGLLGLLGLYLVVRRETDGATALLASALLATNLFFVGTAGFAFWFETVPLLLLLLGYGLLGRAGDGRALWPSVLLVALAVSLKATVALIALAFVPLWWLVWRAHPRPKRALSLAALAVVVPMLPFLVHEILCVMQEAPHSSMVAYLAGRGSGLLTLSRLPAMVISTLWWLVLFGANLNGIFHGVHGVAGEPWFRVDLVLWFAAGLVYMGVRLKLGRATRLERASLLLLGAAGFMSLLLYQTSGDLQAFLPVLPFAIVPTALVGMAGVRALAARTRHPARMVRWLAVGAALLYGSQLVEVAIDAAHPGALMASRVDQLAVVDALEQGPDDSPIITTEHNHIGMVELLTEGRLRPIHAFFPLSPGSTGADLRLDLLVAARWLLAHYPHARFLVAANPAPLWDDREGSVRLGEGSVVPLRLEALQQAAAEGGNVLVRLYERGTLAIWQVQDKIGP